MTDHARLLEDLRRPTRELAAAIPDVWGAFTKLHMTATDDGALPALTKELMALAVSIVKECDGCIAHHARAAARLGATPQQVAETIGVALLMAGGPGTVYGPRAWEAFCEFDLAATAGVA
jgi:AhpD family alkylhydroperoxidase